MYLKLDRPDRNKIICSEQKKYHSSQDLKNCESFEDTHKYSCLANCPLPLYNKTASLTHFSTKLNGNGLPIEYKYIASSETITLTKPGYHFFATPFGLGYQVDSGLMFGFSGTGNISVQLNATDVSDFPITDPISVPYAFHMRAFLSEKRSISLSRKLKQGIYSINSVWNPESSNKITKTKGFEVLLKITAVEIDTLVCILNKECNITATITPGMFFLVFL